MPIAPTQGSSSGGAGSDGWTLSSDPWVFASASTFTIAGVDRTTQLSPGTRLKLTNSTVKYFVVVSSAFSTNTTVTVTGGTDFTLANAAISATYYSYQANPQSFPGWFAYTPVGAGISGSLTVSVARFSVVGRICYLCLDVSGTSNATNFTATLPISARTQVGLGAFVASMEVVDNSAALTTPGRAQIQNGDTVVSFGKAANSLTSWTASGTKEALLQIFYEI